MRFAQTALHTPLRPPCSLAQVRSTATRISKQLKEKKVCAGSRCLLCAAQSVQAAVAVRVDVLTDCHCGQLHLLLELCARFGAKLAEQVLRETLALESEGGLLTADGSRRRDAGGAYLTLFAKCVPLTPFASRATLTAPCCPGTCPRLSSTGWCAMPQSTSRGGRRPGPLPIRMRRRQSAWVGTGGSGRAAAKKGDCVVAPTC